MQNKRDILDQSEDDVLSFLPSDLILLLSAQQSCGDWQCGRLHRAPGERGGGSGRLWTSLWLLDCALRIK